MAHINVAILGAGRIAQSMAETLVKMAADDRYRDLVAPYAVAARDGERAAAFAAKYGFPVSYGSYEELVADPNVNLVYIATPHNFHAEQAILCMRAGKGVLVEKNDAELKQFALLFEFDGDVNHIRHVLYCCTASRTAVEGETNTDTKTPKTETCSFTAAALDNGLVKCRTCEETDSEVYANWYKAVYVPNVTEATGE